MTQRARPDSVPPVLHGGVGGWTACKSCGASITFATTIGGKLSPFQRDAQGNYTIENGAARFIGAPTAQLELGGGPEPVRFSSHFGSCTQPTRWRR